MINRLIIFCVLWPAVAGCQTAWWRTPEPVDPVLSSQMSCHELVTHLNAQHQGLQGWQSSSTVMWVRLPNGVRQRLEGLVACQAPHYFRLTAENLIAEADLGSNASRCWMYIRPGDPAVLTWKHEDTTLLQQMPTGMPYIDPSWLMLVLGVTPLDPSNYTIAPGPAGTQQYWLTALEESPNGRPLRRVIKVDRIRGVVREHTVYDSERNPLVRAVLDQHRVHDGHHIPVKVKLEFPQMDSEISLSFRTIETNPYLSDDIWKVPANNMRVVDLGQMLRHRFPQLRGESGNSPGSDAAAKSTNVPQQIFGSSDGEPLDARDEQFYPPGKQNPFATPQQQTAFDPPETVFDGQPADTPIRRTAEPKWDTPISSTRVLPSSAEDVSSKPAKRSGWSRLWPF